MPLSCRPALPADLPAIVDIYNASIPGRLATADTEPVSVASREAWFAAHQPQRRPVWLCEETDGAGRISVAGWLSFSDFYGRPAYGRTAELSIYVAAAAQRQGVGRFLLEAAIVAAPGLQIDTLLGFIFGHNQPSLNLFAQYGFVRWGELPRVAVLDGIERDLVIVGRRLAGE
ncbi:phosphinothricin acetyltransferase [Andreprevotia lacus DSM 23236]|jgi:phosphinothricin acetyltransferase|uniref:Phosphinothricin acetyltransferase n=1 Tax=Andreprevotia lacus DSM 23236 TaxID=1121001 RepID=A0A1W1Y1F2_9NEIS|nr:GNAT family N-acetyltransferase [Andreprevotia lacus]SMC29972.1 phosphinothricin acetyltransferase [Andreprevotia lacus DSM 23236]